MNEANRSGTLSRRNAITLFAASTALGADAALAKAFGCGATADTSVPGGRAVALAQPSNLGELAVEHFEPLVGQAFTVGGHTVTLANVRRGPATPSQFRQQFAAVFAAPKDMTVASDLTPVAHPSIGRYDLLVTATGADRTALEICFA